MNRTAHERLGAPDTVALLFDRANSCIGLKPSLRQMRNTFPLTARGRHGGRCVRAFVLIKEFGIQIAETLEFIDAEIDQDGILILDLNTAKISNRALRHPRRRNRDEIAA